MTHVLENTQALKRRPLFTNATATLFRDFDRGSDMNQYVDTTQTLGAVPKGHKPGRLKKALMKSRIIF